MHIICISGKAQHGKDTCAGMMKDILENNGKKVLIIHYADLLKYICKTWFGWNGLKDDAGRTLLQKVGTDAIRKKKPDYWVDFVVTLLQLFPNEWDYVIIPDTRFPNEIDGLKTYFEDVIHLRVMRPNFDNGLSDEQKNHLSEIALNNVNPDKVIYNDQDENALKHSVEKFLSEIGGEN